MQLSDHSRIPSASRASQPSHRTGHLLTLSEKPRDEAWQANKLAECGGSRVTGTQTLLCLWFEMKCEARVCACARWGVLSSRVAVSRHACHKAAQV